MKDSRVAALLAGVAALASSCTSSGTATPTSPPHPNGASIGVLVVTSVEHNHRHYGGPTAIGVLATARDGRSIDGHTARNGRTTITVRPGAYVLSAHGFGGCTRRHVSVRAGQTVDVRLVCPLP